MRYIISILGLLLIIGALAATKYGQIAMLIGVGRAMQAAGPPPETVSTTTVQQQDWEDTLEAVASVVAAKGVTLSNDAPGVVSRIAFESGATVKPGQVLVELDASVERAQLASIRAKRRLAKNSLARSNALVESGAIAPAQLDADESTHESLLADEQMLEAQIARKVIRAPFGGRLGLRGINLGQYLAPGTPIAALESAKALYLDFTLPQSELPKIHLDAPVRAFAEGSGSVASGKISAIEPTIDAASRNVKVRATVAESTLTLAPGMFLRVSVVQPGRRSVTAIPSTAVVHAAYGDSVFCVELAGSDANGAQRRTARQQFVKLGQRRGDFEEVLDGVKTGQEIVTAGAFKLRNGIPLTIASDVKLEPSLQPKPANN